jgi:signal peptidase I
MSETRPANPDEGDWIDTLQGLFVAFVVAMIFRGFVMEGFFIPTGSMGPTLRGQHVRMRGDFTGYAYDVDAGPLTESGAAATARVPLIDPMVTRQYPVGESEVGLLRRQSVAGDRVLVLKYLPWLLRPGRWDVPVFRNPPFPLGDSSNYIKRLVGLPNESVVLADGDIFTGAADAPADQLRVQRKPEMVQRAVWQPVWRSDWGPADIRRMEQSIRRPWPGPALKPAVADRARWSQAQGRAWTWPDASSTSLELDLKAWPITDWNAYNAWRRVPEFPMSDIRVRGTFEPSDPDAFTATLELVTRGLRITAEVRNGQVVATVAPVQADGVKPLARQEARLATPDQLLDIDVWHVDQQVWIFVNGTEALRMPYELDPDGTSPTERMVACGIDLQRYVQNPTDAKPQPMQSLAWRLAGSPFEVRNLRIDRDLYYQPGVLLPGNQMPTNGPLLVGRAFACDPENPARLGPDDYLMMGDNSPASRDGRFWGRPHPILKQSIGFDAPFVVPGELLVGKAWCVYFPATYPLGGGLDMQDPSARSPNLVPNFGSLRFIR